MSLILKTLICGLLGLMVVVVPALAVEAPAPMTVFVSILPQQWIVQQIGAELVDVRVMVPPGADPHAYEPKPAQMAALAHARIYFSVGVPFEGAWLPRFTNANPNLRIVASDQGIQKIAMAHDDHGHGYASHPPAHDEALDPHTWLSPPLIKIMAQNVLSALVQAEPSHTAALQANYDRLVQQIDQTHRQIQMLLSPKQGTSFMVFHPSWGYFAHTYGVIQIPIEMEGKEPKPAQMQHLIEEALKQKIKVIFSQPQFSMRSAQVIADAVGARVVPADPLAPDLLANLLRQAQAIHAAAR